MEPTQITKLADLHLKAWNESDVEKRNLIFKDIYAENIRFLDPSFEMTGYEPLNQFIDDLLKQYPAFNFTPVRPADINHHVVRLYWQFGTAEQPGIVTGMDLFEIENDLVQTLLVFLDPPKAA